MVEALAGLDAMLGVTLGATPLPPTVVTRVTAPPMAYATTELMRGAVPAAKLARRRVGRVAAMGALVLVGVFGTGLWWVQRGDAVVQTTITAPREVREVPTPAPRPSPTPTPIRPTFPSQEVRRMPEDVVPLPGGTMRLNNREVYAVAPFFLDRREVTVDSYAGCVARGGCRAITRQMDAGTALNVCNARIPGRGNHPINCVSFAEAAAYCAWRGARLPRNSEWEYAAKGIPSRTWPWGEHEATPLQLNACGLECPAREGTALNYLYTDAWITTAPAGLLGEGATPEGVLDLAGNVSEWVDNDQPDPQGRNTVRGGGFLDGPVQSTRAVRRVAPGYIGRTVGFRCAR